MAKKKKKRAAKHKAAKRKAKAPKKKAKASSIRGKAAKRKAKAPKKKSSAKKIIARVKKSKPAKKAAIKKQVLVKLTTNPNVPAANEIDVGIVKHYFTHIMVAVVEISGDLKVGDTIHIKGATTDMKQKVLSMQIDRKPFAAVKKGDAIGLKVEDHVRDHDRIYVVK
jgi:putative protease